MFACTISSGLTLDLSLMSQYISKSKFKNILEVITLWHENFEKDNNFAKAFLHVILI